MSGVLFQLDQPVQDNQLDIVVTLLDYQIDVALGSSLQGTGSPVRVRWSHDR